MCTCGGLGPSWSLLAWPIMHRAPNGEIDEDAQNAKRTLGPPNGQYGYGQLSNHPASHPHVRHAGSRQLWPYRQCGGAAGGLWLKFGFFFCFGNFICIRIRLTSCERDYNCQSDI